MHFSERGSEMPIVRINAQATRAVLHDSPQPVVSILQQTRNLHSPVIVMTHGYSYRPHAAGNCPHDLVLSPHPSGLASRITSWPRALELNTPERLSIAFGWDAQGTLWAARQRALLAGRALAQIVTGLRRANPTRSVHFIGHSLGIEVALEALQHLPPGHLDRIISLTGATYAGRARRALASRAGLGAEFINITSRENDLFDFCFERIIAPCTPRDRAIGFGLEVPNAVTLQLDCTATLDALSHLGVPIAPPDRRICHGSSYMRPGVFGLYRRLLSDRRDIPLQRLRDVVPRQTTPRWSRLFALPRLHTPLPFAQNAP